MRQNLIFLLISLAVLILYICYQLLKYSDNKLHITFCDIGQGDAIHIRTNEGDDILIDGGPGSKVLDCLSKTMPLWDRKIEAVYLTHPDADHLTGLIDVVKNYKIIYFGTSKAPKDTEVFNELTKALSQKNIKVNYLYRGDVLKSKKGFEIKVLWPTQQFINNPGEETNDYSLVQLLTYGKFKALLTGDVPSIYLNSIMPGIDHLDLFKPPHHGSKTGIDEFTFQHIVPHFAVISAGRNNRYGHPNKEVLQILEKYKVPYKNTANVGNIEIISDGEKWSVKE